MRATAAKFATSDDRDDAGYVWHVFCNSGLRYTYMPASEFPSSTRFQQVDHPQTGDIAWWPSFVGIYNGNGAQVITATGFYKLADLSAVISAPKYYRLQLAPGEKIDRKPEAGECQLSQL